MNLKIEKVGGTFNLVNYNTVKLNLLGKTIETVYKEFIAEGSEEYLKSIAKSISGNRVNY